VEEEYSGEQELVQIHVPKMEERIVKESLEDFPGSAIKSLVQLGPKITGSSNVKLMTPLIQFTTRVEMMHVGCIADKDDSSFIPRV